jgi:hypothetical protein
MDLTIDQASRVRPAAGRACRPGALAVDVGIPADTLARRPRAGAAPAPPRRRLEGGLFAAAADFALWFRAETGLACLDLSEDDDYPVPWTREGAARPGGRTRRVARGGARRPLPEPHQGGATNGDTGEARAPAGAPTIGAVGHATHTDAAVGHRESPARPLL